MLSKVSMLLLTTLLGNCAGQKVIMMEGLKPGEIEGTWYAIQRTQPLYNDTAKCISATLNHKNGQVYEMVIGYRTFANEKLEKRLIVKDDSAHPAQFLFADQGRPNTYAVLSRTPVIEPADLDSAIRVMEKNEVRLPLLIVDQADC
ncbi:unnamed protein product [Ixodes hexagonus]